MAVEDFARMTIALERIPTETYQSSEEWDMMGHWHDYLSNGPIPGFISEAITTITRDMSGPSTSVDMANTEVNSLRGFLERVMNLRRGREEFSDDDERVRSKKIKTYRRGLKLRTFKGNFLLMAGGALAMFALPSWGYIPQIVGAYAMFNGVVMLAHKTYLHITSMINPELKHVGAAVAYDDRVLLRRMLRKVYVRERNVVKAHVQDPVNDIGVIRTETTRRVLEEVLRYVEWHRKMVITRHAVAAGAALLLGPAVAHTATYTNIQALISTLAKEGLASAKGAWNGALESIKINGPRRQSSVWWNSLLERLKISSNVDLGTYKEFVKEVGVGIKEGVKTLKQASFRVFG